MTPYLLAVHVMRRLSGRSNSSPSSAPPRRIARVRPELAVRALAALILCAGFSAHFASAQGTGAASAAAPSADTGMSSAAPQATPAFGSESMLYPGEDFRLGPGDLISVSVFLQPDYQATVRISEDGTVLLPFIGSVPIEGLTVKAAQALIADRLRAGQYFRDPDVIIRVLDTINGSVIVTGEVHAVVPVANERSLKEVLLTAGGLPATASHTVKIVREGLSEPIVVDLGTDLASSKAANIPIRPHDIIQITRASVVYVLGAFKNQGAFPLDQASPLTLLQLAALGGGVGFEANNADLHIIRTVGTERKVITVDIKSIRDGHAPDPILQANDIVFLPTQPMKAVLKSLGTGGILGLVSLLIAAHAY